MNATKLLIGLGNPDTEYQNTRHNVGFMFLDYLARRSLVADAPQPLWRRRGEGGLAKKTHDKTTWEFDKKSNSLITKVKLDKTSVILAKPQTYVNKSGEAVKKLCSIFHVPYSMLVVIHDDLDIPFGNTKISFDKNSGGHKGIESIMRALKTKKFYRLRVGLAKPALQKARLRAAEARRSGEAEARQQSDKKRDEFVVKMVLSKFSPSEQGQLKKIFKEAYDKLLQIK
ncbi:MAG: aminoacyl-tRNA hydrolase [Candidatus Yanofskybacteria bacterium]|nr:aminoacyl-tRNA hydrolase [Candidatus Yanofskybacteria bacterium]